MIVLLNELVNATPVLSRIVDETKENPVPANVSYKLLKLARTIQPELDDFNRERTRILQKFGTEIIEDGKLTGYDIKDMTKFDKFMFKLLSIEVDLHESLFLNEEDLKDMNCINVSFNDLASLGKLIKQDSTKLRKVISIDLEEDYLEETAVVLENVDQKGDEPIVDANVVEETN